MLKYGAIIIAVLAVGVYLNNTSLLAPKAETRGLLLAHRGVHQTFTFEGLTNESCTATMIYPPEHEFLENTIASIAEAFRLGADVVEIDVHPTIDGQFAVFHDWTIDCRTEGTGVTREHSMEYLNTLDIGYGYTADGGRTFPFRGEGIGLMPTLDEVLNAFPGHRFIINLKSDDPVEGELVSARLSRMNAEERSQLSLFVSGNSLYAMLRERFPTLRIENADASLECIKSYIAWGWSGAVPATCLHADFAVPQNFARFLWRYPDRLRARMDAAGVDVQLVPPYYGGLFDPAFDDPEDLTEIPMGYGIITNKIEVMGTAWNADR